mgnify:CR=1 FL=1
MKKTKLTRRTSALIIFGIVIIILLGLLTWLFITLFSEASSLLQGLNDYIDKLYKMIGNMTSSFNIDKINLSNEILSIIETSTGELLETASNWLRNALTGLINFISSLPSIIICVGITIITLYFICVDKIYILDQIEYHLPKVWVKKLKTHLTELIETLGGYLKAQISLVVISFVISLVRIIHLRIYKVQYKISITDGTCDRICRCIANFRLWNSNVTMGNHFCNKW